MALIVVSFHAQAYVDRGRGVAEEQLAKAGYRLAYVLSYVYSINRQPATIKVVNITTVRIHSDSDDNQVIVGKSEPRLSPGFLCFYLASVSAFSAKQ